VTAGDITLGSSATSGILRLGAGKHSIGAVVKSGTGSNNLLEIQAGAQVMAGGNWTLAGLAAAFTSFILRAAANFAINGAGAGNIACNDVCRIVPRDYVVTVSDLVNAGPDDLLAHRCADGGGNDGVEFDKIFTGAQAGPGQTGGIRE